MRADPPSSPVPPPAPALTTTAPTSVAGPAVTEDDLVRFVAATEAAIAGTPDAGIVEEQPEEYIALAQAACARFTAGESFDSVAADLLAELDRSGTGERLVGALLGAATRTICPEHAAVVPVG
jgi:hypothetical protein